MKPSRWVERRGGPTAGTGIAFASRLPLRRYRDIPGFLRDTRTVRGQLRAAPGLAGYSLRAQFLRKTFWTLSLWESAPDLALFVAGDRHRGIAAGLANRIKAPLFVRWPHELKDGPPAWSAARARLAGTGETAHPNPERQKGRPNMEQLINDYIALWNERSPSTRRPKVDDIFGPDAIYVDPLADVRGAAAFDAVIEAVQARFAGASLTLLGTPDAHHQQARFTWGLGPAGSEPVVIGFDVLVAGDDGRIASVYGFLDKVPS